MLYFRSQLFFTTPNTDLSPPQRTARSRPPRSSLPSGTPSHLAKRQALLARRLLQDGPRWMSSWRSCIAHATMASAAMLSAAITLVVLPLDTLPLRAPFPSTMPTVTPFVHNAVAAADDEATTVRACPTPVHCPVPQPERRIHVRRRLPRNSKPRTSARCCCPLATNQIRTQFWTHWWRRSRQRATRRHLAQISPWI